MLGIRWTIGDVSEHGFEALRLSILGAARLFGSGARYAVAVNSLAPDEARRRCGDLDVRVDWLDATGRMPRFLSAYLDPGFAQGVAWKLAPLRLFPDCHELALDNDVILWERPAALERWLSDPASGLVAEDVRACFGQFAELCGGGARNLGIRGLPPGFDLERALRAVLVRVPVRLCSELDEQGLQLAALQAELPLHVVAIDDVTVCSPFWPHLPDLGRCGAHFCGLNARSLGWELDGVPAEHLTARHWQRHRAEVAGRVLGRPAPAAVPVKERPP